MTEAEWLACTDPTPMIRFLEGQGSKRKLRLFACACCRRIWRLLGDQRSRRGVELAEAYADGLATKEEMRAAYENALQAEYDAQGAAYAVTRHAATDSDASFAAAAAFYATGHSVFLVEAASYASSASSWQHATLRCDDSLWRVERAAQVALVRDIFADPFRLAPSINTTWLVWHGGLIPSLARRLYEARDFGDMPVLADALEEAGCTNPDILGHCRSGGEHVRGCWVIDLLLGKE